MLAESWCFLVGDISRVKLYRSLVVRDVGPRCPEGAGLGRPEENTEGPGTASSEPLLPS